MSDPYTPEQLARLQRIIDGDPDDAPELPIERRLLATITEQAATIQRLTAERDDLLDTLGTPDDRRATMTVAAAHFEAERNQLRAEVQRLRSGIQGVLVSWEHGECCDDEQDENGKSICACGLDAVRNLLTTPEQAP